MATKRTVQTEFFRHDIFELEGEHTQSTDADIARQLMEVLPKYEARAVRDLETLGDGYKHWPQFARDNIQPQGLWDAPTIARAAWDVLRHVSLLQLAVARSHGFQCRLASATAEEKTQMMRENWEGIPREGDSIAMRGGHPSLCAGADLLGLAHAALGLGLAVIRAHCTPFEPAAETGRRVRRAATRRNEMYSAEQVAFCRAALVQRRSEDPQVSVRTVAAELANKTGIPFETIRDWFRKPRKPRRR